MNYDAEIRVKTDLDNGKFEVSARKVKESLDEIGRKADGACAKLDSMEKAGELKDSRKYRNVVKELERWIDALDELIKKREMALDNMELDWDVSKGSIRDDAGYQKVLQEWSEAEGKARELQARTGKYFSDSAETVQKNTVEEFSGHLNLLRTDVEEYASALKELEEQGKYFGDADYDRLYLAWKNAVDEVKKYQAELNKQTDAGQAKEAEKAARAAEKQEAIQQRLEAQAERNLQKENARIQAEAEKQAKLQAEEAEQQRLAEIKANATVADQRMIDLLERKRQLTAEIAELEKAGVTAGYREYDSATRELASLNSQLKGYKENMNRLPEQFSKLGSTSLKVFSTIRKGFSSVGSAGSKAFSSLGNVVRKVFSSISGGAKKSSGLLATFASRMKGLALSLLIFNWISKGFNAMISGMKTGFENLMKYSDDYANSVQSLRNAMATLGNSFAAAFAPIVQVAIPYLVELINWVNRAVSAIGQLLAALTGKSTFIRAKQVQDSYNKSLKGTAAAADKARGALAKFDDLDVWEKQKESSGGGDAGGAAGDMFEEVPVDPAVMDWFDGILDKLKPTLDYMGELKKAFMEGFWDGLGDWEYRWDIIKKGLEQIRNALIDIWTDPAVLAAADAWLKSLMYMFGSLVGSIASIALTIAAAFIGGLGEYMEKNVDRIKAFLISAFNIGTEINYLLADLFQSIAYIFEAFASESGIRFMAALIGSIADASMGMIELALKLGRDILEMLILPITENKEKFRAALEGLLAAGATVLEGLKASIDSIFDKLNAVYDAHFKPFFDSVANGLSELVGIFLDAWNGSIQPVLDAVAQKVSSLLTDYITPFLNGVIQFIGNLVDMLQMLWEAIEPHIEWLISFAVPLLGEIFNDLFEQIMAIIGFIVEKFNSFMNFLNTMVIPIWKENWDYALSVFDFFCKTIEALITFIVKVITSLPDMVRKCIQGDWKGAWELAQNIFISFKEKVESIINIIKGILEGFFGWVNGMIQSITSGLSGIGSSVSKAFKGGGTSGGGYSRNGYSASSYSISPASLRAAAADLPHLASGSVIRGGNPFLAVLGDQRSGQTNVEAPLSTIRQAVREELAGLSFGGGNVQADMTLDGETFARLLVPYILDEMNRQGLDVNVLGVT